MGGDALARLNQVSRTEALRMAGLISASTVSAVFGYRVSDPVVRAVSQSTGVTGQRLLSMTLAHYAGSALEPLPLDEAKEYGAWAAWRYRQRTVLPKHSNACPSCLRENGGRWLLKWRLIWSFACVRHQSYLISQCSGCGSALHRGWPGIRSPESVPGPRAAYAGTAMRARHPPHAGQAGPRRLAPRLPAAHRPPVRRPARHDARGDTGRPRGAIPLDAGRMVAGTAPSAARDRRGGPPGLGPLSRARRKRRAVPPSARGGRREDRHRGRPRHRRWRDGRKRTRTAELGRQAVRAAGRGRTGREPVRRPLPSQRLLRLGAGRARRRAGRHRRLGHLLPAARPGVHPSGAVPRTHRAGRLHRAVPEVPRRAPP
ncbi:TniQ family protein [Streptomyces sp. NRRL F-5053]|uniref:TniQ family protein n=1 Tax=Streptomyces sp. NRRL F-5053 TaxID=1463854 RepID=UPI002279700B|nr:TniQ family protein [Streptomyces sp. NRRL F-5053]